MWEKHILIRTDNVTAKAYLNRQGGTRLQVFRLEAIQLLQWAELHLQCCQSRACGRPGQFSGRLAEPEDPRPVRVDVKQGSFPTDKSKAQACGSGSLCYHSEHTGPKVYVKNKVAIGVDAVSWDLPQHMLPPPAVATIDPEDYGSQSEGHSGGFILAVGELGFRTFFTSPPRPCGILFYTPTQGC